MVRKFLLMMDRRLTEKKMIISRAKKIKAKKQNTDLNKKQNIAMKNGFTLSEFLVCLLIVCILMITTKSSNSSSSLPVFMKQMESRYLQVQQQSFALKQEKRIRIDENYALFDHQKFQYPKGIVCEPASFGFSSRGNIQTAGSFICSNETESMKLVIQIGTGRIRDEKTED